TIFFFQAEDGIRDDLVTGVQTCALPISDVGDATAAAGLRSSAGATGERAAAAIRDRAAVLALSCAGRGRAGGRWWRRRRCSALRQPDESVTKTRNLPLGGERGRQENDRATERGREFAQANGRSP